MEERSVCAAAIVAVMSTMLLAGALIFQWSGYAPCEMCMWQRWAHAAAAMSASMAMLLRAAPGRVATWLAIACIATSGAIGIFHAGVEWKLWEGVTTCSARFSSGSGDVLIEIMKAPLIRCDEAAWRLLGISMAGYNAILSLGTSLIAFRILRSASSSNITTTE